jgi:hypothetical protein
MVRIWLLSRGAVPAVLRYGVAFSAAAFFCVFGLSLSSNTALADTGSPASALSCSQVAAAAVGANGSSAAGQAASAVIAAVLTSGASASDTGICLANVALGLAGTNMDAAKAIARAVANEGTSTMASAFAWEITSAGGPSQLAGLAMNMPEVEGGTRRVTVGSELPPPPAPPPAVDSNNVSHTAARVDHHHSSSPPPACVNPSCT